MNCSGINFKLPPQDIILSEKASMERVSRLAILELARNFIKIIRPVNFLN